MISATFDSNLGDELSLFRLLLTSYSPSDQERIMDAAHWASLLHANQKRASGDPYFIHPLNVAKILIEIKMDASTIMAAILHDIEEDTDITREQLAERYGNEVEELVNGVTKISMSNVSNKTEQSNETIRKMFLAMAQDIRVILIKLADKLHNMNTLEFKQRDKQIKTAQECLDIYAPLAGKLGIYWLKMELEDLAFRYINPPLYSQIASYCIEQEKAASQILQRIKHQIKQKTFGQLDNSIASIPRNNYSIYRLLNRQNSLLANLVYPYGIRILCQTIEDCYRTIGIVHHLYKPLDGQFRDFIAMPKENQYQGLHTTVISSEGRPFEIQIRTHEMDKTAEYGVCAFWIFNNEHNFNPQDITLIQRIKSWEGLQIEADSFVKALKNDALHDMLTIFTHKGEAQTIATGSTALDYAFKMGTAIGLGCVAIKIDGHAVEFNTILRHNQVIEVLSEPTVHPKLRWLLQVNSPKAKAAITKWYRKHGYSIITNDQLIYTFPLGSAQPTSIEHASCCNPSPSNHARLIDDHTMVLLHRADCLVANQQNTNQHFEAVWLHPSKIIYRYKVESLYLPYLFGMVEKAVYRAGAQLISGTFHENNYSSIDAVFTVEMATGEKRLAVEQHLAQVVGIKSVECL